MTKTINEKVDSFLKKYNGRIVDDSKRCYKITRVEFFTSPDNKDIIHDTPQFCDSEKMLTIEVPESMLKKIADIESIFFNNIDDVTQRRIFATWLDQQYQEQYLRMKYAAVQKAYQEYCALLHLTGGKSSKFNDLAD